MREAIPEGTHGDLVERGIRAILSQYWNARRMYLRDTQYSNVRRILRRILRDMSTGIKEFRRNNITVRME